MSNKKTFLIGLLVGLLVMGTAAAGFTYLKDQGLLNGEMTPDTKVNTIYSMLDGFSINEYDKEEIMEDMYRGMLNGVGDPYTYYFDKESYKDFTVLTEGMYMGVGITVTLIPEDNAIGIITVYAGSPAEKSGIKPGDEIVAVDGTDVIGKPLEDVTTLIKGRVGTTVNITVERKDMGKISMDVHRENISIPTVSHKMLDGVIGYIKIDQFDRVTLGQFKEALNGLTEQQMHGLIIDLRDNPGGLLSTVTDIADLLMPKGVIVYTEDKTGDKKYYYSDEAQINLPIVLLVNGNSASASEVLCGAIKDTNRGEVVGTKTFGKGIVQNLYELKDGSAIKITVAKYYTPSGVCIQGEGIEPDYFVEIDEELWPGLIDDGEDAQLQKGIEVMWGKMADILPEGKPEAVPVPADEVSPEKTP